LLIYASSIFVESNAVYSATIRRDVIVGAKKAVGYSSPQCIVQDAPHEDVQQRADSVRSSKPAVADTDAKLCRTYADRSESDYTPRKSGGRRTAKGRYCCG
jgi:hypothetical protein